MDSTKYGLVQEQSNPNDSAEIAPPELSMRQIYSRLLVINAILAIITLLINLMVGGDGQHLNGEIVRANSPEMTRAVLMATFVSLPLLAAIIALAVAALPYRRLPYTRKYFRAWLICLIGIYSLLIVVVMARWIWLLLLPRPQ